MRAAAQQSLFDDAGLQCPSAAVGRRRPWFLVRRVAVVISISCCATEQSKSRVPQHDELHQHQDQLPSCYRDFLVSCNLKHTFEIRLTSFCGSQLVQRAARVATSDCYACVVTAVTRVTKSKSQIRICHVNQRCTSGCGHFAKLSPGFHDRLLTTVSILNAMFRRALAVQPTVSFC